MSKRKAILGDVLSFPLFPETETVEGPEKAVAYKGRPDDWGERERALDVTRSWIVEAPAGSGKTGLLIQRYLKLLGDESVSEPEQVLAITFTKAATEEIRERVVRELERASGTADGGTESQGLTEFQVRTAVLARRVLERDRGMRWRLREEPHRINVRTIDSVCAEIGRSLPVLTSGVGRQAPRPDATELYRRAARRTVLGLGREESAADRMLSEALRKLLLHRDGNVGDCERLIAEMLPHRDQWGELAPRGAVELSDDYLEGTVRPRLNQALDQAICAVLTEITGAMPPDLLRRLASAAAEMGELEGYKGRTSPIAICAGRHEPPEEKAEHLAHWRALIHLLVAPSQANWRASLNPNHLGFLPGKGEKERIQSLLDEVQHRKDLLELLCSVQKLPPAVYPEEQWDVAKALFRVLAHAVLELQKVFAEVGECDFTELALQARAALRSEGGVGQIEVGTGRPLQHLLIDEMQDTSTSQYDLIGLLTRDWGGQGQTMFLVGDPKQSIYLFRQARVERFVETMRRERIGGVHVGRLRLTENFRSQAGLVEQTNESFARMFPRPEEARRPEQVPFVPATAARTVAAVEEGAPRIMGEVWHMGVLPAARRGEGEGLRRQQGRLDARAVRGIIQDWRSRPLPEGRSEPWRIAVLVRARTDLREILPVLRRDEGSGAIPFRAVEIDVLNERQEVLDLHALTRALLHPADRMAWLAILRAPWCGLSLAELHLLTGADDSRYRERCMEDLIEERGDLLREESCARLRRIWPILEAGRRAELPLAQRVERTWRALGGDAYLGREELANAEQYLMLLAEVEELAGVVEVREMERRMQKLYAEAATTEGAVELMTIHKAKGLEWDVVLVPELDRRGPGSRGRLLEWEELTSGNEAAAHAIMAPLAGKGDEAKELNQWISGLHRAREAAERKRMFYVAATRAREELHLFGTVQRKANGEFSAPSGSLLAAAWDAASRHFAESGAAVVIPFPQAEEVKKSGVLEEVAASEGEASEAQVTGIERLPVSFDPAERFRGIVKLPYGDAIPEDPAVAGFERPEGSLAARSLGNAVHVFLELVTTRAEGGAGAETMLGEVRGWVPRIEAVLRSDGTAPGAVERLGRQVLLAIENTLRDPVGRWIVGPHAGAVTEARRTTSAQGHSSVRVDRSFRGGTEPMMAGEDCLWIVDYKTATHGASGMEDFLGREREKYRGQMEAYGRVLGAEPGGRAVRVALYYPLLGRLVWWVPGC